MDDLRTRALLVDFDPTRAGPGAIGTVVTRDEVAETAARGEFPATLFLELDRADAQARVAVDWDADTLDQLLASTDGDEIALWFDEGELARAFDESEVEAHGIREKSAVLVIAVTAAGATAAPGFARLAADTPDNGGAATAAVPAQPSGAERGLQMDQQVTPTPAASTGAGFNVNPQADHTGAVAQPAGAERALLQEERNAVQTTQGTTAAESDAASNAGGNVLSDGEIAVIAGALVILAAGFGITHRRTPPVLPA
jgi:hypothetical protein